MSWRQDPDSGEWTNGRDRYRLDAGGWRCWSGRAWQLSEAPASLRRAAGKPGRAEPDGSGFGGPAALMPAGPGARQEEARADDGQAKEQTGGHRNTSGGAPAALFPKPGDPVAVARQLIEAARLRNAEGLLTARWWRGGFWFWTGTHWVEAANNGVRSRLYAALENACYLLDQGGMAPWEPTRHKIANVAEAFAAIVHLDEHHEPPAWIEGPDRGRVLAVSNGLLELTTRKLSDHTPALFNQMALPYPHEPAATEPERWLRFLDDLWPGDPESAALLQEWAGYVLSGQTDQHKILLLVGPPRSGKGTIARVLTALVGRENTAGPTLASLGTNFGLSPLLGKALAVIADARLGGPHTYAVVERLLSISGEDALTVDRKYREPWTGRLPTRFTVISNELPNLGDASGAIASRFVALTLTHSWLGQEDRGLTDALLAELPGILNWALDGLDRLAERGRFTEPTSSRDAVLELVDLASPTGAFIREECLRGPGLEVPVRQLYQAWREWCIAHGRSRPTTEQVFGRDLRAVIPGLKTARPRDDDARYRVYVGVALRTEPAMAGTADHRGPDGPDGGVVRSGPRSDPLWAELDEQTGEADDDTPPAPASAWSCDRCGHQTSAITDMTGLPHRGCGGRFQAVG